MTVVAVDLRFVFGVTKSYAERRHILRRPRVTAQLVAGPARRDVAPGGLRARCVTAKTGGVRAEIRRYGHRDPRARRPVTVRARDATHGHVLRVIEFHSKTYQP